MADKLSDQNKTQLDQLNVEWVELRNKQGYKKFKSILENLQIPHKDLDESNIDKQIDNLLSEIFT